MRKLIRGLLTELGVLKPKTIERAVISGKVVANTNARPRRVFKPKPPQTGGGASNM